MLSDKLKTALLQQYNQELLNAEAYLDLAAQAAALAWKGFAHFFQHGADEECQHARGIAEFLLARNALPKLVTHNAPMTRGDKPSEWVGHAYALEQANTRHLNELYFLALAERDGQTLAFLEAYLAEQTRGESELYDLGQMLARSGSNAADLQIDTRLLSST